VQHDHGGDFAVACGDVLAVGGEDGLHLGFADNAVVQGFGDQLVDHAAHLAGAEATGVCGE